MQQVEGQLIDVNQSRGTVVATTGMVFRVVVTVIAFAVVGFDPPSPQVEIAAPSISSPSFSLSRSGTTLEQLKAAARSQGVDLADLVARASANVPAALNSICELTKAQLETVSRDESGGIVSELSPLA